MLTLRYLLCLLNLARIILTPPPGLIFKFVVMTNLHSPMVTASQLLVHVSGRPGLIRGPPSLSVRVSGRRTSGLPAMNKHEGILIIHRFRMTYETTQKIHLNIFHFSQLSGPKVYIREAACCFVVQLYNKAAFLRFFLKSTREEIFAVQLIFVYFPGNSCSLRLKTF